MKPAVVAFVLAAAASQALAQSANGGAGGSAASPRAPASADAPARAPAEPDVKHVVVEDDLSRIEELRVRGLTRRITVHPKGGQAAYEIVPNDPGRDASDAGRATPGGAGQRVWPVLRF